MQHHGFCGEVTFYAVQKRGKMTLKKFAKQIQILVSERLGAKYQVRIKEMQKNNGVRLQGLIILERAQNISPTIYLDDFYEAYQHGFELERIVEKILQIYKEDMPKESIDMSFFRDFLKVKDRICYRLIDAGKNKELLEMIPHVRFLDLAICFYYAYQGRVLGEGSILIYNTHMEMWNTSTEELLHLAQENTPVIFPWECKPMETVIEELLQEHYEKTGEAMLERHEQEQFLEEMPMQILSNQSRVQGAAVILYPGLLEKMADELQGSFYIIPSSIHEVILLPVKSMKAVDELKDMIREVNRTQVERQEVLSDRLYIYSKDRSCIEIL